MDGSTHDSAHAHTRQRLLEAAGEVFADKGFRAATIREICALAGANVAAVNYHFGDKEQLYLTVLKYAHNLVPSRAVDAAVAEGQTSPEQRLRAFIRGFMHGVYDEGRPAWHGKLLSQEMMDPTAALDTLVEEHIRPQFVTLNGILRDLLPSGAPPEMVLRCAASIVGQCLHYHHGRAVMTRLHPGLALTPAGIAALADHIADFSLHALAGLATAQEGNTP